MIDIKEHVRQEFIDAFGEEKGAYWYDSLTETVDNLTRCRERCEELERVVKRARNELNGNISREEVAELLRAALARLEGDQ